MPFSEAVDGNGRYLLSFLLDDTHISNLRVCDFVHLTHLFPPFNHSYFPIPFIKLNGVCISSGVRKMG